MAFSFFFYLFRAKQCSDVVPHAVAPAGAHYCVTLALAELISACDAHTSGNDAVRLQDVDHLTKLLHGKALQSLTL